MKKPVMLMILDGFGIADDLPSNAIKKADTPNLDRIIKSCSSTVLNASGEYVGLPDGQMGNSEVGHTNIGAGRVVYQELTRITKEIRTGVFFENEALKNAMLSAKKSGKALHLMGLLSDGGVHSHIDHLLALTDMAKRLSLSEVYIHAILDGRDVPPSCAEKYIKILQDHLNTIGVGKIASVCGRYYAMDRDKRWERLTLAYDAYTLGCGRKAESAEKLLELARENGETDEFVLPGVVVQGGDDCSGRGCGPDCGSNCGCNTDSGSDCGSNCGAGTDSGSGCGCNTDSGSDCGCSTDSGSGCGSNCNPVGLINDGDSIIFFNFRPDRAREITRWFVDPDFAEFERKRKVSGLNYVCFTCYDATIPNVSIAFRPQSLTNTLGAYVSSLGKTQLRIAETEKYAHVTFFFNGGVEAPYNGEDRILVPSPKVATYDMKPEMSAYEVTDKVCEAIESGKYDLIIMNYANCDMVGHTGVFSAAVKAVETVDTCLGRVANCMQEAGGILLITADHGNADYMFDDSGAVVTAHSTNPVPLILLGGEKLLTQRSECAALCDIAPTLLDLMELPIPPEMSGRNLIEK